MTSVEIASVILDQIRATDPAALMAWGANKFVALNEEKLDSGYCVGGVKFNVRGLKYTGTVVVRLMGNDTYRVEIGRPYKGQFKTKMVVPEVYCDNLMDAIDHAVER
jgi:hypothetical protein